MEALELYPYAANHTKIIHCQKVQIAGCLALQNISAHPIGQNLVGPAGVEVILDTFVAFIVDSDSSESSGSNSNSNSDDDCDDDSDNSGSVSNWSEDISRSNTSNGSDDNESSASDSESSSSNTGNSGIYYIIYMHCILLIMNDLFI